MLTVAFNVDNKVLNAGRPFRDEPAYLCTILHLM
uniref:Macaca fascicularis brain cDNA, clone: QtrA-18864 n=1 Tax=Macaca fascicularis TaxID=9541 RepID=I7GPN5_MACFA|nr:unnamed protein product [Macaca fascicularis]